MNLDIEKFEFASGLIQNRRAVFPKMYTGERVNDELIMNILENANWAPTHKKTEPWRFHIITGDALLEMGEWMAEHYKTHTPENQFKSDKYEKRRLDPFRSSHVIAVCMRRDPHESVPEWEEIAAVACSVQNMWLSCSALGLGSYWSTGKSSMQFHRFHPIPDDEKCLGLFFIGVPVMDPKDLPKLRGDIRDKITWRGRE